MTDAQTAEGFGFDSTGPRLLEIAIESPASAAARSCLTSYFAELDARFETGFDPAASSAPDVAAFAEPAGLMLVARLDGEPVGCGALRLHGESAAEIKRMWVSPSARGHGIARQLLAALEEHARRRGAPAVRLDTNRHLVAAIAMYRGSGYREIPAFNEERYADHWFEKQLS